MLTVAGTEGFAKAYRVVFYDGEKEHEKGFVSIHSMLKFKKLQYLLSQKAGLHPSQITIMFVCMRTNKAQIEKPHKLPVNENTNFSVILTQHDPEGDTECYFYFMVKRAKRDRRSAKARREAEVAMNTGLDEYYETGSIYPGEENSKNSMKVKNSQTKAILRRPSFPVYQASLDDRVVTENQPWMQIQDASLRGFYNTGYLPHNLQFAHMAHDIQNVPYLSDNYFGGFVYGHTHEDASEPYRGPRISVDTIYEPPKACYQCLFSVVPFHCCINDPVFEGFGGPSPFGPVGKIGVR